MDFALIRGDKLILCGYFDWMATTDLAFAFGWKPKSIDRWGNLNHGELRELDDGDARSLAVVIDQYLHVVEATRALGSVVVLPNNMRWNARGHKEMARIADFCRGGSFETKEIEPSA